MVSFLIDLFYLIMHQDERGERFGYLGYLVSDKRQALSIALLCVLLLTESEGMN